MPARIVLIPGPLTGAMVLRGVCDALWQLGQRAYVTPLTSTEYLFPPYWLTQAATAAASLPEDGDVVLAGHSGAGVLLPAIGRFSRNRDGARVTGYLFIDCDLPRDGCSRFDLMEDESSRERLRGGEERGFLRRPGGAHDEALIEEPALRAAFLAQLPRVPVELYEERIGVPDDWPDGPCAYLGLSAHYPRSITQGRQRGWTVREMDRHHLAPLTDPQPVAAAIAALATDLEALAHGG